MVECFLEAQPKACHSLRSDLELGGVNGTACLFVYPQCTHVIVDSADVLSRCHLNSIQKNDVQIANPAFIQDSVRQRRLLDVRNYDPLSPAPAAPPAERSRSGECVLPSTYCVIHSVVDILTCQRCYRGKKCPERLQIYYVSFYLRNKQNPEGWRQIEMFLLWSDPKWPGDSHGFRIFDIQFWKILHCNLFILLMCVVACPMVHLWRSEVNLGYHPVECCLPPFW